MGSQAFLLTCFDYPGSFEAPAREQDTSDYPRNALKFERVEASTPDLGQKRGRDRKIGQPKLGVNGDTAATLLSNQKSRRPSFDFYLQFFCEGVQMGSF